MLLWNVLVLLLGLLILAGSTAMLLVQRVLQAKGHVVLGEVIDKQENDSGEGTTYTYTVKFLTHTGEVRLWKKSTSTSIDALALGAKVPLVYDPHGVHFIVSLQSLNPLGLPLRGAGWGVILVEIGSSLLMVPFLLHTSLDALSLVEMTLWTAGIVAVGQGLIRAVSQFRLLKNGIEVTAVISPGGENERGFVSFITRNGKTSYYCIPSPYVGTPGRKVSLLYDQTIPARAMIKPLIRPLRQFFINGGNGAILCLTGALLVLFRGAPLFQALLGALFSLAGLWIFLRIGSIALIDNWHSATAQRPYPIIPSLVLDIHEEEQTDNLALPEAPHQSRSTVSPVKQKRNTAQSLSTSYHPTNPGRFLRPALLKSGRMLLVTGGIGAFLLIIGTLVGRNILSWGLLLEIGATMALLVIIGAFVVRGNTQ